MTLAMEASVRGSDPLGGEGWIRGEHPSSRRLGEVSLARVPRLPHEEGKPVTGEGGRAEGRNGDPLRRRGLYSVSCFILTLSRARYSRT